MNIYIDYNKLEEIHPEILDGLENLKFVDLRRNKNINSYFDIDLYCLCTLEKLKEEMKFKCKPNALQIEELKEEIQSYKEFFQDYETLSQLNKQKNINLDTLDGRTIRAHFCLTDQYTCLNCENILILGDFNHKLKLGSPLKSFMLQSFDTRLFSPRESTTNARTVIDEVFGRIEDYNIEVFIYESYSSHHKPLVIQVHEL
ncbi:hypothetical protein PVAND_009785 [Polypedilum vanderplanki]|uniref:Uncharacterized protein n=1 Tax=Polypedilum vanderplanki TaxID=319348 RepID=A0A9J6CDV9_POLVA|nr:hypothetical protein PVAND_009785 [Polypedilum vanderplanki]